MVNKTILLGNVGKDPEVRYLESGSVVAKFSLATNKSWKNKAGEKMTHTDWHNIEVWGNTAKVVEQYVKAGDKLYVEGELTYDKWQDEQGNNKTMAKVKALSIQMLGSSQKANDEPDF